MDVTLDWYELSVAAHVGQLRSVASIHKGCRRPDGTTTEWSEDIEGAAAEMAVSKALNTYWPCGVNTFHVPDLGDQIGVRHTTRRNGCLIVRHRDEDPTEILVLVVGQRGTYRLAGWMSVGGAKAHDEWLKDPGGLGREWFVPQRALHPVADLRVAA